MDQFSRLHLSGRGAIDRQILLSLGPLGHYCYVRSIIFGIEFSQPLRFRTRRLWKCVRKLPVVRFFSDTAPNSWICVRTRRMAQVSLGTLAASFFKIIERLKNFSTSTYILRAYSTIYGWLFFRTLRLILDYFKKFRCNWVRPTEFTLYLVMVKENRNCLYAPLRRRWDWS